MTATQLALFDGFEISLDSKPSSPKGDPIELLPLHLYDYYLVSCSGGKDSVASFLHLLDLGVDKSKIFLYHQRVDGSEDDDLFFDWDCTDGYIRAIAKHFGVQVRFQYREGGLLGEMLRSEARTGDVMFEDDEGNFVRLPTTNGKLSTRMKWPAKAADLRTRWCSGYGKVDPFRRTINNDPKFQGGTLDNPVRILVLTGERRAESANRARYLEAELHACNSRTRIVHAWRPVIDWDERRVWGMYRKYKLLPHPSYLLGWSRCSCLTCIFSSPSNFRMLQEIAPDRFERIADMERRLNHTIDKRMSVIETARMGSLDRLPKDNPQFEHWVELAFRRDFPIDELVMDPWVEPEGAYGGCSGGPI